jgi:hypothetical protein
MVRSDACDNGRQFTGCGAISHSPRGCAVVAAAAMGAFFLPGEWCAHAKPVWIYRADLWPRLDSAVAMMGIAAWLVWRRGGFDGQRVTLSLFLQLSQLSLVLVFFGLRPTWPFWTSSCCGALLGTSWRSGKPAGHGGLRCRIWPGSVRQRAQLRYLEAQSLIMKPLGPRARPDFLIPTALACSSP